jgi:tripartite-type tricarboxylate transporter receptor subunit TctC
MRKAIRFLFLLTALLASSALAQQYPNRPVHFIISQGAGGPTDVFGRLLAEHLGDSLNQSVIVENKPGDNSMIGTRYVAAQAPDGYTLLLIGDWMQLWPVASKAWNLDLLKDFTYIGTAVRTDSLLVTSAQSPYKSFDEFMQFARANPGRTNYPNVSLSRVTVALRYINQHFNLGMTEVSYKSSAEARLATLRGELNFYSDSPKTALDKATRPLLFVSSQRHPRFPDIPTLSDGALASLGLSLSPSWVGVGGPANMSPEVVAKLSAALHAALESKDFNERSDAMGFVTIPSTPVALRSRMADEGAQWTRIAKEIGLTPQ